MIASVPSALRRRTTTNPKAPNGNPIHNARNVLEFLRKRLTLGAVVVIVRFADCEGVDGFGDTVHVANVGHPATPHWIVPLNPPVTVTVRGIGEIAAPALALMLVEPKVKLKSGVTCTTKLLLCA